MLVKELLTALSRMPMDAEVAIDIDEDVRHENYQAVTNVVRLGGVFGEFVVINSEPRAIAAKVS